MACHFRLRLSFASSQRRPLRSRMHVRRLAIRPCLYAADARAHTRARVSDVKAGGSWCLLAVFDATVGVRALREALPAAISELGVSLRSSKMPGGEITQLRPRWGNAAKFKKSLLHVASPCIALLLRSFRVRARGRCACVERSNRAHSYCLAKMSRAHGVVVSHPLRMRKALGSNPSVSIIACYLCFPQHIAEASQIRRPFRQ